MRSPSHLPDLAPLEGMDHTAALRSLPSLLDTELQPVAEAYVEQVLRACALSGLAPDLEVTLAMWAAVVDAEPDGPMAPLLRAVLDAAGGSEPVPGEEVLALLEALEALADVESCAWGELAVG